jgi:hypothetical protein
MAKRLAATDFLQSDHVGVEAAHHRAEPVDLAFVLVGAERLLIGVEQPPR